jgi:hypothetical protein
MEGAPGRACGACGTPCGAPGPGESSICTGGVCLKECLPGHTRCNGVCVDPSVEPAHCGACGNACAAGTVCAGGACVAESTVRIVSGLGSPEDIVLDATNLYYTDIGTNEVWQVDKATLAKTLLASGQAKPYRIAVDGTHVYWSSQLGGAILRAPIGGGAAPELLYTASGASAVAVDDTQVYWSESGTKKIYRAPKTAGGTPTPFVFVYPESQYGLLADELKVDATRIYGTRRAFPAPQPPLVTSVYSFEKATGSDMQQLATCTSRCRYGIALDAANVYHLEYWVGQTRLQQLGPGESSSRLARVPALPAFAGALAADECAQYWTGENRYVYKHQNGEAFGGGITGRVLTGAGSITRRIAVDEKHVYWTDAGGFLGRVPK